MSGFVRISCMAALAMGVSAGAALAVPQVKIYDISAAWGPITGGAGIQHATNANGVGVYWGSGSKVGSKSGYSFDAASTPSPMIDAGETFDLGDFWHFNRPITAGTAITAAVLTLTFNVEFYEDNVLVGSSDSFSSMFRFDHDETDNGVKTCTYGGKNNQGVNINGCADRVSVGMFENGSNFYEAANGDKYYLDITGFFYGGSELSRFLTVEDWSNKATLRASFTSEPNVVPLPAAAWLMIGGLGALGVAARRRRSDAA